MKTNAYSYKRFSSAQQLKGDSLRRQTDLAADYARKHGLNLMEVDLSDLGVSAYHGLNATEGALARFIAAVDKGAIPRGSYLLVESLDRMSREQVTKAFPRFAQILNAGILIVTLSNNQVYDATSGNDYTLFNALSDMIRANQESEHKSQRVGAAWANKRDNASSKKLTSIAPLWLRLSGDRKEFLVDEEKAEVVRMIFRSASDGKGSNLITKELNRNSVKPFGKTDVWVESYVTKILKNRAVIGEFQPHSRQNGKRVAAGDAIPNYFPQIVTEDQYNAVKASRRNRSINGGGARGENQSNLFSHVGYCGYCGGKVRHRNKGYGPKGSQYLICINGGNGAGCIPKGWKYPDFETAFLTYVKDIDLKSLIGGASKASEIENLRVRLISENEKKISKQGLIKSYLLKMEAKPDLAEIFEARLIELKGEIAKVDIDIAGLESEIAKIENEGANISDAELSELIQVFKSNAEGERFKLSDRIGQIVKRIDFFVDGNSRTNRTIAFVEENETDLAFKLKLIKRLREDDKDSWLGQPHFVVHLENGSTQIVIPNPDNPEKLIVNVVVGEGGYRMETDFLDWSSSDDGAEPIDNAED